MGLTSRLHQRNRCGPPFYCMLAKVQLSDSSPSSAGSLSKHAEPCFGCRIKKCRTMDDPSVSELCEVYSCKTAYLALCLHSDPIPTLLACLWICRSKWVRTGSISRRTVCVLPKRWLMICFVVFPTAALAINAFQTRGISIDEVPKRSVAIMKH